MDANQDNVITRDEWRGSTPALQARDLAEGRAAGREDRVRNQGWDLEGQRDLEMADSGYQAGLGSKAEYQAGYREAFRRAYREGWDRP